MLHISLFSGIGSPELASEWMGWKNIVSCEINDFGNRVLSYYWPEAYHHTDIKTLTYDTINNELIQRFGTDWRNDNVIVTGGFPCQPYSAAGKRLGKEDERHLFPEMLRAIREIQPTWVVGENVSGLINWSKGLVFDEVQADLEASGYEVIPFILPACGVNAPHRRDRVFFVAYSGLFRQEKRQIEPVGFEQLCKERLITDTTSDRRERKRQGIEIEKGLQQRPESAGELAGRFERLCVQGNATDTQCTGFQKPKQSEQFEQLLDAEQNNPQNDASYTTGNRLQGWSNGRELRSERTIRDKRFEDMGLFSGTDWSNFPTQSPICSRNDGISSELSGITVSKHRQESIKAYGNSIVPQVIYQIFKSIQQFQDETK